LYFDVGTNLYYHVFFSLNLKTNLALEDKTQKNTFVNFVIKCNEANTIK